MARGSELEVPLRTQQLLRDASRLEREGYFAPATLLYSHFLEQMLLLIYLNVVEMRDFTRTRSALAGIMEIKDDGRLTFGRIIREVSPIIEDNRIRQLCEDVKEARDALAAHFYFVAFLDRTNRTKRAFYDVNNYRKLIRRMYKLVRNEERIEIVEEFLTVGSPLARIRSIQTEGLLCEKLILEVICRKTREKVESVIRDLVRSTIRTKGTGTETRIEDFLP